MEYETQKEILCKETGAKAKVGDTVTIQFRSGCGMGGCTITKITDTGFHFSNGGRHEKSVQYKDLVLIY